MSSLLTTLLLATFSSSVGLLLIGILRAPLLRAFGARAAYWIWLLAPASIVALFIPRPHFAATAPTQIATSVTEHGWHVLPAISAVPNHIGALNTFAILAWLTGVLAALCTLVFRQRRFVRELAPLSNGPDGTLRSGAVLMPSVVGAWSPKLIIPIDFESRYSESRRKLILAHEAAHLARWDTRVTALAVGWKCIFWFNPLVHWAVSCLRFDQELACDATTVQQFNGSGRDYAAALLDAQMADQLAGIPPVGCHWQSAHPLKKRITMLTKKMPGHIRMRSGIAVAIAISILGSAAVWAAQPHGITSGPAVSLSMIWFADHDSRFPGRIVRVRASNPLMKYGEELKSISPKKSYAVVCTPRAIQPGQFQEASALIVRCKLSVDGKIIAEPKVVLPDGQLSALDVRDPTTGTRLYVVLNASTSPARMDQAQRQ